VLDNLSILAGFPAVHISESALSYRILQS